MLVDDCPIFPLNMLIYADFQYRCLFISDGTTVAWFFYAREPKEPWKIPDTWYIMVYNNHSSGQVGSWFCMIFWFQYRICRASRDAWQIATVPSYTTTTFKIFKSNLCWQTFAKWAIEHNLSFLLLGHAKKLQVMRFSKSGPNMGWNSHLSIHPWFYAWFSQISTRQSAAKTCLTLMTSTSQNWAPLSAVDAQIKFLGPSKQWLPIGFQSASCDQHLEPLLFFDPFFLRHLCTTPHKSWTFDVLFSVAHMRGESPKGQGSAVISLSKMTSCYLQSERSNPEFKRCLLQFGFKQKKTTSQSFWPCVVHQLRSSHSPKRTLKICEPRSSMHSSL